jgi:hypothetical protein
VVFIDRWSFYTSGLQDRFDCIYNVPVFSDRDLSFRRIGGGEMGNNRGSGKKVKWTVGTVAVMVAVAIPTVGIGAVAYYLHLKGK